jgi:hypothetical protein
MKRNTVWEHRGRAKFSKFPAPHPETSFSPAGATRPAFENFCRPSCVLSTTRSPPLRPPDPAIPPTPRIHCRA